MGKQFNLISLLFLCSTLYILVSCNNQDTASIVTDGNKKIVTKKSAANSEQITRIRSFLSMLHNNPTLTDYQSVMGYSDYAELQFYLKECGEQNNINTPLVNNKCHSAMIKNWQKKTKSISYYLTWLSEKIPNTHFEIISVIVVNSDTSISGQQVEINLDNKRVIFWLANSTMNTNKYGELKVLSINGIPLSLLRERDSTGSIIIASGLTNLVRPYTEIEITEIQQEYRKSCEADPECFKLSEEDRKDQASELEESTISTEVNAKYIEWCKKNQSLCNEQEEETSKINKQLVIIENECKKNTNNCELQVKKWSKSFMSRKNYFCEAHVDECKKLAAMEKVARARQKDKCIKKPMLCEKMNAFQQALMLIDDG